MAASEEKGQGDFFSNLKAGYLDFVEGLREKNVPLPHLIVPLVVILAIVAGAYLLSPGLLVEKRDISLTVKDNLGRPVSGAVVEVVSNGQTLSNSSVDASGKANLQGVPINAQVRVTADGFAVKTRSVSELSQSATISLQSTAPPTRDVGVKIIDNRGQPIESAFVQLSFASGDSAPAVTTIADGTAIITVQEAQLGPGTITVTAPSVSTQQAVSQEQLENGLITITVEPTAAASSNGEFTVMVTSASGPVKNSRVVLVDVVTDSEKASELTSDDGTVKFQDVGLGSVYTVRVSHPQFNAFSREFTPTADNNELSVQLTSRSSTASSIMLTVVDEELRPLNAVVSLFDTNGNLLERGETSSSGEFTTTVEQNLNAYATAYSGGYLPGFVSDLRAGSTRSITLQQALPGNSVQLSVAVSQDGFPASNAEVSLYRSGGFFLGIPPLAAGGQGIANVTIPSTFEAQTYRVYATAKKESAFGQSDIVEVRSEPVTLAINLLSLPANVTVYLKDVSSGAVVSSGTVEAIVENLPVANCFAANGSCVLSVASGKTFSLRLTSQGYLPYATSPLSYSAGEKANLSISLFPLSLAQGTSISFLGLFDSANAKVREVANAETYAAKFLVTLPQNAQNAGFYLQVGDEETVEESVASIAALDTQAPFVQSDSKLPREGSCYLSGQNNINLDKKWAFFSFPRGFVGTKEFAVKIKVSKNAVASSNIVLRYKAFAFKDNLPLLAPSDVQLIQNLTAKSETGNQLVPEDTCSLQPYTQEVPVTSQTLACNEDDICWKATLSDATARGSPSTFQPQIGNDFDLELEILAPFSVDSLAVSTEHFTVKNSRQTLSRYFRLSLEPREFNLPFVSLANRKAKMSMTLTPLKTSQSAALTFTLASGDKKYSIPLTLSIGGQNIFVVNAAPSQIAALADGKVTVIVRDRNQRPIEDASVSLYECDGSPFSANEPEQLAGDGSSNNGQNGVYRISVNPTGLGEIGVRVENPDFKMFESCLITVTPKDFLSIDPDALEFTGSSLNPEAQQVTITNPLNEPVQISTSINCGGDPVPVKIFPLSTTVEPNADSTVSIKVLQNATSTTQCIATFNARIGQFKSTEELPISVNVNCPDCQLSVANALPSAPLPQAINLYAVPPFFQDSQTIPLRLQGTPTCRLDGFRISYAGTYGPTYGQGVLAGLPTPAIWSCGACSQADSAGKSHCNVCQQVQPSAYQCGACTPDQATAYTSSSLPIWGSASCNQCASAYGAYNSRAFMSPLGQQGYPVYSPTTQRLGYEPSVGGYAPNYREDFGYSGNYYPQRFGVYPAGIPGSPQYPGRFNGYNPGYSRGFGGPSAMRDALHVDECTASAITLSADFSFMGQAYPGQGNLYVTLPDGLQKVIRVNVVSTPFGGASLQGLPWNEQCGVQTVNEQAKVDPGYKFTSNTSVTLSCPTVFDLVKYTVSTKNNDALSNSCDVYVDGNVLRVYCDFSKDEKAKKALDAEKQVFVKVTLNSKQNPSASVNVGITANFEKAAVGGGATGAGSGSSGGSGTGPVTSGAVQLKVYRSSDSAKTSLCGNRVETGAALKAEYSFDQGDDASARKLIINKGGAVDRTVSPLSQSGAVDYTVSKTTPAGTDQVHVFQALTKYGGSDESKTCQVTAIDETPLITSIKPVFSIERVPPLLDLSIPLSPVHFGAIATDFDLSVDALKAKTGNKDAKAVVDYQCQTGKKTTITQNYNLDYSKDYGIKDDDLADKYATDSLEFTKCSPTVDSTIPYKIKVTILDTSGQKLEEMYYGKGNAPVKSASDGETFTILNYPEAPPQKDGNSQLPSNLKTASFDECGRIASPLLSAIALIRSDSSGAIQFIKSTEELKPSTDYRAVLCARQNYVGKNFNLSVEYNHINGNKVKTELAQCAIAAVTGSGFSCTAAFSTDAFLSPENIAKLRLDVSKPVSFYAEVVGGSQSRFFCKYWPNNDGTCEKVAFKVSTEDPFSYKDKRCRLLYPPNPNVLECDLGPGDEVELATGMYLKVLGIDSEISLQGYFDAANNKDKLDCASTSYEEMEFEVDEPGKKWESCFAGGPLLGETTSFIAVKYNKMLGSEIPHGKTERSSSQVGRFTIVSQFGSTESWLKNGYNYSFEVIDRNGKTVRKVNYVKPVKTLKDLGIFADNGAVVEDSNQGVYIMGKNDVAKFYAGIARFDSVDEEEWLFEVRRSDKPVIQDCYINAGTAITSGVAGGVIAVFAAKYLAVSVAFSPILATLGAGVGGAYLTDMIKYLDDTLLEVEVGDANECNTQSMDPDLMVYGLKRMDSPLNNNLPEVCVVITTERVAESELKSKISNPNAVCV